MGTSSPGDSTRQGDAPGPGEPGPAGAPVADASPRSAEQLSTPRQRLLYLVAAVAQGVGAIAVQPFAIRMMDADEWGRVSFLLSLIAISLVAITAGFPLALSALYFDPDRGVAKARALNGFGGSVSLALGALAALALWAFASFGPGGGSSGAGDLIYFVAIFIITMHGVSQMTLAFLRSQGRAGAYVVVIVLATVAGHFAGLGSMILLRPTAITYLTSFAVCVLLSAAIGVALTRPGSPFAEREGIGAALRMGVPVLPHSLALIVMQQGESVLLFAAQGEAVVGRYNAVMPLALGPIAIVLALGNVWQTVLISLRGEVSKKSDDIQREAAFVAFLLACLASGSAVFATYVLVGDAEPELFQLARILPLVGVGYVGFMIASSQMFAIRRTAVMSVVTPLVAVAMLAVAWWPASSGDLFAVGVVKVAAYLALGIAFALVARRGRPELVRLRPLLASTGASVAVAAGMLLLPTTFVAGLVSAVVSIAAVGVLGVLFMRRARAAAAGGRG